LHPNYLIANSHSALRVDWFLQLAKTADNINFTYKTVYCDLFPRNVLDGSARELRIIDFDRVGCLRFATSDFDTSCVICSVYEAITKQPCHGGSIDQTLSVENCVNGWLERMLSTDISWSVPHGVTIDIGPCELRDFLRRWKVRRIDFKYSWKDFVDIERHDGGASDPFSAALARCH